MEDTQQTHDNIRICVFKAGDVGTPTAAEDAEPVREYRTHNATRTRYHETVIAGLDGDSIDIGADALAMGDSDADLADVPADEPLDSETFRTSVTDSFTDGQTFSASIFLDSTQANGETFREAGLVAETADGDLPINRFVIDTPLLDPKSENETVTIDIDITQEDA